MIIIIIIIKSRWQHGYHWLSLSLSLSIYLSLSLSIYLASSLSFSLFLSLPLSLSLSSSVLIIYRFQQVFQTTSSVCTETMKKMYFWLASPSTSMYRDSKKNVTAHSGVSNSVPYVRIIWSNIFIMVKHWVLTLRNIK